MKKLAFAGLLVLAACGSTLGYMNTDVLEPKGFTLANAAGVKFTDNGKIFGEGTLTYTGPGDMAKTYIAYVDSMRPLGWTPTNSEEDAAKRTTKLLKDMRTLSFEVTPEGQGNLRIVIKVTGK